MLFLKRQISELLSGLDDLSQPSFEILNKSRLGQTRARVYARVRAFKAGAILIICFITAIVSTTFALLHIREDRRAIHAREKFPHFPM